jgi:hypothetical protein
VARIVNSDECSVGFRCTDQRGAVGETAFHIFRGEPHGFPGPAPTNRAPTVTIAGSGSCQPPCSVTLSADASDPDGDSLSYDWSECASGSGATATCGIAGPGSVTATVTVNDGQGGIAQARRSVQAAANSAPTCYVNGATLPPRCEACFPVGTSDADGDAVSLVAGCDWLSGNECCFNGGDSGQEFDFTVQIQDSRGATGGCSSRVKWHAAAGEACP